MKKNIFLTAVILSTTTATANILPDRIRWYQDELYKNQNMEKQIDVIDITDSTNQMLDMQQTIILLREQIHTLDDIIDMFQNLVLEEAAYVIETWKIKDNYNHIEDLRSTYKTIDSDLRSSIQRLHTMNPEAEDILNKMTVQYTDINKALHMLYKLFSEMIEQENK